ncbi:MAG: hypothetical protein ACK5HR_05655 [Mycoplasmatales bacterium]
MKSKFYFYKNNKEIEKLSEQTDEIKNKKYEIANDFVKLKNITQYSDKEKKELCNKFKEDYQNLNVQCKRIKEERYIVRDYFSNEKKLIKDRIEFLQILEELIKSVFSDENIAYDKVSLEYLNKSEELLKRINVKEEIVKRLGKYNIERLFPKYIDNQGNSQESTPDNAYRVLLKNTKRNKTLFNFLLKKILDILNNITKEKIVNILKSKELNDLIFEYITTYKVEDIERFLNATVERNDKSDNSTRKEKIQEQIVTKEKLEKLDEGKLTKKVQEILTEEYNIENLLEVINNKKPNNFIGLKKILNDHFVSQFLEEDEKENLIYKKDYAPEEKLIIKEINEFMKGRYRKVKQKKIERFKFIKSIFENKDNELINKVVQRVSSRIYMSYINYNKYKVFLPEDIQDKYKDSSVFKEIIKCEDTFRKKLSTYISELNFMYFAKLDDSDDILGTRNYNKMKILFDEANEKFSTISQISGKEVLKDEFLNKMYSAFELRNHVYHYQRLLKHDVEGKVNEEGYCNYINEYNDNNITSYVNRFNYNLKEDFKHILISNNLWLLEEDYQDKIVNIISNKYENKPTYLVRFDKLFSKKIKYKTNTLDKDISMKELLYKALELESQDDIKDKFKSIITGSLRYYYQTYYDYLFFEYLKDYEKIKYKTQTLTDNNKENLLLSSVNKIVQKSSSLETLIYDLQSSAGDSEKQIKNYNNVYIQLLIHLFYDFMSDKLILNTNKINVFINIDENRDNNKKCLIDKLQYKLDKTSFDLVKNEKMQSIFDNELTLRLFSISEFLKKRSISSMENDLKKYKQFLCKLKERYSSDFEEVWGNVYKKIIGTDKVHFDSYVKSVENLIDILELIVLNINKNKAERFENNFAKNNKQVLEFYGIDNDKIKKEDLCYEFFDINENKTKKQSILENIKKYEDGVFEIRTIPHDFFIEEENQGKVKFLMRKHMEYINEVFNGGYKDVLSIYSDMRKRVLDIENAKFISPVYSKDYEGELEEIKSLKNIAKKIKDDKNIREKYGVKEFIVYVQEEYKEKYKEFINNRRRGKKVNQKYESLYSEIKELKNVINLFDFISNLINLKSVNKAEQLIHDIHSRYVSGYRDIERNYTYSKGEALGVVSNFKKNKVVKMLNKISNLDDSFEFNKEDSSIDENIITSRRFTVHKKAFQEKDKERKANGSINNEGYRLKQIQSYDTKSMKALADIYVSVFSKKNIVVKATNYEQYDFDYEVKNFMEDVEFISKRKNEGIPLISKSEVEYLISFIDNRRTKTKITKVYDNGLFSKSNV